ncbi:recQ-mediated genome instability protein 2 isoform 2-T2 [Alca torda]
MTSEASEEAEPRLLRSAAPIGTPARRLLLVWNRTAPALVGKGKCCTLTGHGKAAPSGAACPVLGKKLSALPPPSARREPLRGRGGGTGAAVFLLTPLFGRKETRAGTPCRYSEGTM